MNPTRAIDTAPADIGPAGAARPRRWPARVVVVLLVLAGTVVTSWPVGATYVQNYRLTQEAEKVEKATDGTPPAALTRALARARDYNQTLAPETLRDPWTERGTEGSADHDRYLDRLALFPAMGTLTVPAIRVRLPIYHDATVETMAHGVGHFFGTSLPVGGPGSHAVLAGHTGMSDATLFDRLPELGIGDRFQIRVYGEVLTYQVDHITKVLPTQLGQIRPVPGKDFVTLLTCVPRLVNTYRLLVRGIRVPDPSAAPTTRSTTSSTDLTVQRWMVPRLVLSTGGLAVLLLIALGWVVGDSRRRRAARAVSVHR